MPDRHFRETIYPTPAKLASVESPAFPGDLGAARAYGLSVDTGYLHG